MAQFLLSEKNAVNVPSQGENRADLSSLRDQIEDGLRSAESVTIELNEGSHTLLLGENADGVKLVLCKKGPEAPLWEKQYSRVKCAVKGALRAIEQNAVFPARSSAEGKADIPLTPIPADPQVNAAEINSIWKKVPIGYKDVTIVSGNDTEVSITVVSSGSESVVELTWKGHRMLREYDTDWQAKHEALKMANSLVEWAN
ncbi:hypothetical protein AMC82_CH01059 [Rhizobium phaseoli]|nr:hypothetical protein AMC84_CH01062 [Rhizobium phaseoli]ANL77566.1 hypothetical protein AMC82_CH01059 [Rhizobium phaseoli]